MQNTEHISDNSIRDPYERSATQIPDLEGASRSIMTAVLQLSRRLRAQRPASSVSLSQLSVLGTLYRLGAMPAARLADHECLQPQSLTRVIVEMEAAELIRRRRGTMDRRTLIIELTPKGLLALARDIGARREWLERAMAAALGTTERMLLQLSADLMLKVAACDFEDVSAADVA